MDPNSGRIFDNVTPEEAEKRGLVPIPDDQLPQVRRMNRKQRRAWAAIRRRTRQHDASKTTTKGDHDR